MSHPIARRTFLLGGIAAAAGCGPDTKQSPQLSSQSPSELLTLLTPAYTNVALHTQDGQVFDVNTIKGSTVLVISGWHTCSTCDKIKKTLAEVINAQGNDVPHVVVFNTKPARDSTHTHRDSYVKAYHDIGIPPGKLHILFTQHDGIPSNDMATHLERSIMHNAGPGHSLNVFVFNKHGHRMSYDGTYAAIAPDNQHQRTEAIGRITTELAKARGKTIQ